MLKVPIILLLLFVCCTGTDESAYEVLLKLLNPLPKFYWNSWIRLRSLIESAESAYELSLKLLNPRLRLNETAESASAVTLTGFQTIITNILANLNLYSKGL
jgi:hypothetical protein